MENDLNRVVDALPGLIWTALPDGRVDFVNRQWCEYTGLGFEDCFGQGWRKAIHPEDLPQHLERWQSAIVSGAACEAEVRMLRFDGEFRWFLFRANPIKDASGAVVKWCGMNWEIEDRKQGEKLLRESEQQFKTVFDEAGTGITLVDLTPGVPIRTNRALQTMLGCTEEELSHFETFDQLTHEANRETDALMFRELCEGRINTLRMEKHFVRRDGKSVWANVIFTLLRDAEERPRYIIVIHEDVTERTRTLESLQAKQELLDLAQKAARAMAFDWHIQKKINAWSPEQEALYGIAPGTFDGTYDSWKKLVHPEDWPVVVKALRHAQETGDISAEYRVVWPDGSIHWLMANGQMFFDEEGQPLRMVGFTADITSRKVVEEELRQSEEALDKARSELARVARVMSLGALTASIAHEVNQPLSGIITNASTCLRMLDAEPPNVVGARETARRTIRDGHRASDVITRLRALFSKKDAASELVDLNEATREVIALSRSELERNRVILRTELAEGLPHVVGDRVQLQQVILNLIRNGSDSMSGADGRLRELVVKTELEENHQVRLSVRDAGIGLEPQTIDRLFQPFYTTKEGGMGIGLSVSHSIIQNHRGHLSATPNKGPGATFSFSIPCTVKDVHGELSPNEASVKNHKHLARHG